VVSILKVTGDPDQLLAWKTEDGRLAMGERMIGSMVSFSQTVVKTADGLMMINFWSTTSWLTRTSFTGEQVRSDLGSIVTP